MEIQEFFWVFAKLGLIQGVLTNQIFATLIFVIILTTLLPPFGLKWLCRLLPRAVLQDEKEGK